GLATPAGQLLVPPAERALGRRAAVLTGAGCTTACLILLAAWPDPPLAAALVLLTGVCLFSAYPMLLVAQGRALFPDHLAGRGVTTVNLAQVLGSALLPMAMGAAVAAAPAEAGFRLGFALLAASVAAGALVYARGRRAA
ncbi:MAG: hypothetical protein K2X11_14945, partial [Acetobacteraceae bacterium]|nr:hypothetical protein [Acetobacteraceae bacterium]